MNNIHNVENNAEISTTSKDAQSNGDPVLSQNYLQHADHYLRRYNELNEKRENPIEKLYQKKKFIKRRKSKICVSTNY